MNTPDSPSRPWLRHEVSRTTRIARYLDWLRTYVPGMLLVLLLLGGLAAFFIYQLRNELNDKRSLQNAPLQSGSATVIQKGIKGPNKIGVPSPGAAWLTFGIHGNTITLTTSDTEKWTRTRIGDMVSVTYRTSRNRNIYVEDWQPQNRGVR